MDVQEYKKYNSIGEWRDAVKTYGYSVPLPLCVGLSQLIKQKNMPFQEAFQFLLKHDKIILNGKSYIYDISASELWEDRDVM